MPANDTAPATHRLSLTEPTGFLVWTKSGKNPRHWHRTRDEADAEAGRLAMKYPGRAFFVVALSAKLKAVPVRAAEPAEAA